MKKDNINAEEQRLQEIEEAAIQELRDILEFQERETIWLNEQSMTVREKLEKEIDDIQRRLRVCYQHAEDTHREIEALNELLDEKRKHYNELLTLCTQ